MRANQARSSGRGRSLGGREEVARSGAGTVWVRVGGRGEVSRRCGGLFVAAAPLRGS